MAAASDRPPTDVPTRALTVKQAADEAGCSESFVRKAIREGHVPSRKVPRPTWDERPPFTVIDRKDLLALRRIVKERSATGAGRKKKPARRAPSWAQDLRGGAVGDSPRQWGKARVEALELLLNADLRKKTVLRDLVDQCRDDWYGGGRAVLDEDGLARLRRDLRAVAHYHKTGRGRDKAQTELLQELHHCTDWPTELKPDLFWEVGADGYLGEAQEEDPGSLVPLPALPSDLAHFIAGYYMGTVERLRRAGLYPPLRCKYEKCRRWFVLTEPDADTLKTYCCDGCKRKHNEEKVE